MCSISSITLFKISYGPSLSNSHYLELIIRGGVGGLAPSGQKVRSLLNPLASKAGWENDLSIGPNQFDELSI
jgi:hypothetical protein